MNKKILIIALLGLFSQVAVTSSFAAITIDDVINNVKVDSELDTERLSALIEYGMTSGTAGGFNERAKELLNEINQRSVELDSIFMFQPLVDMNGLLPPVIEEAENVATVKKDRMEVAGKVYKILRPARFSINSPSWRDYLFVGMKQEEKIDPLPKALQPKTDKEKQKWIDAVRQGWQVGRERADSVYHANMDRMKRDYIGMLKYKKLLSLGLVNAPQVASDETASSISDNEASFGLRKAEIVEPAKMESRKSKWRAGVVVDD